MKFCHKNKNSNSNYTIQNKKLEILSIKSCKGVMIKKVKGIIRMPVYFIILLKFFSGIFFDMLTKKIEQLIE